MTSLCGLILAAGASSRMGRDKALLPWPPAAPGTIAVGGATLLSAAILALKPFTEAVVVVAGENAGRLASVVEACGATMVRNPAPERGQFSSLRIGLEAVLGRGCEVATITPVDCPPLSAATLELLRGRFEAALARGQWAVAPESNGRRGHPLFAGRQLIDAFLSAPASSNAREVKRAHGKFLEYVPVSDSFLSSDVNTPDEYAAVAAIARLQPRQ